MKNGDDIRPISHLALEWLGPSQDSCLATQIKAHCHRTSAGKKRGKRTPNYANPQDEYILILLEYKLMPWLSDWTFWQEWEVDRITFTFSTWGASVWHRINSQSLNKLSFGQTQHIIKPRTVKRQQIAVASHWKGEQHFPLRTTKGGKKTQWLCQWPRLNPH